MKADAELQFVPVTAIGYQGITINTNNGERAKNPLGQDKRVRQALELAIDRKAISQVVFDGIYPPMQQPFPQAAPISATSSRCRPRPGQGQAAVEGGRA